MSCAVTISGHLTGNLELPLNLTFMNMKDNVPRDTRKAWKAST